ncbi:hypothetical protein ACFY05_42070 [Microtetraspora fusca]|uniref:Zinc ribbon domain-containing protein n=1 Tax=Microtetraspora fusca TaxID=1997 RepID=A0ABW6VME4_MICFU
MTVDVLCGTGCGRPVTDNATVCCSCGAELHQELVELVHDDGLADELDAALARQASLGTAGGRSSETPLPYGEAAAEATSVLRNTLTGWVRILDDDGRLIGPSCPPAGAKNERPACAHPSCQLIIVRAFPDDTLPAMASWLAARIDAIRHHPAGAEAVDELLAAVRQARQAIDRPADRVYCGPCGAKQDDGSRCMIDLYARPDTGVVQCRCGAVWDVWLRRDWLLAEVEDVLGTATEIARAVTGLGHEVTPERIWQWAHRGRLIVRGAVRRGARELPVYRVGDVLDLVAHST